MKTLYLQAEEQELTEATICPHCGHEHVYSWEIAGFDQHAFPSCYVCDAGFIFSEIPAPDPMQAGIKTLGIDKQEYFLLSGSLRVRQN
jgi:transcription elongation factor Elf1